VALAVVRQPGAGAALAPGPLFATPIRPASRSQRAQSSLLALLSLPVRSVSIVMTLNRVTVLRAFASANAQRLARISSRPALSVTVYLTCPESSACRRLYSDRNRGSQSAERVLCGHGGNVYASPTRHLEQLGHDR
jgi:hypothetical protein